VDGFLNEFSERLLASLRDRDELHECINSQAQQPWGPGETGPQLLGWGTNDVLVPQLFGRIVFKKQEISQQVCNPV